MSVVHRLHERPGAAPEDALSIDVPNQTWTLPAGLGVAVMIGGIVFMQLSANRTQVQDVQALERVDPPAPALGSDEQSAGIETGAPDLGAAAQPSAAETAPPFIAPPAVAPPAPAPGFAPLVESPAPDIAARLNSPTLVVDFSQAGAEAQNDASLSADAVVNTVRGNYAGLPSADEDFAHRMGVDVNADAARAERMDNQPYTLVEGAVIPAVLETAISSELPGYVRAIVSRDVRGFDGANVLVPRGSRLIGQYRSGGAVGQSRAFVIWTRLIRPDGVSVRLAAPATDELGRGGLEGEVDRHFLQRFGGAFLLTLVGATGAIAGQSGDTQVIIAPGQGALTSATSSALQADMNIAPTVEVPQGSPIRVFVTGDLDFSVLNEPVS